MTSEAQKRANIKQGKKRKGQPPIQIRDQETNNLIRDGAEREKKTLTQYLRDIVKKHEQGKNNEN